MSAYRLSKRADSDLIHIFVFGIEQFGLTQAEAYQQTLKACFERIGLHPNMGRKADHISTGVRRHETGSHIVLYENTDEGVLILALVHKASVQHLKL